MNIAMMIPTQTTRKDYSPTVYTKGKNGIESKYCCIKWAYMFLHQQPKAPQWLSRNFTYCFYILCILSNQYYIYIQRDKANHYIIILYDQQVIQLIKHVYCQTSSYLVEQFQLACIMFGIGVSLMLCMQGHVSVHFAGFICWVEVLQACCNCYIEFEVSTQFGCFLYVTFTCLSYSFDMC